LYLATIKLVLLQFGMSEKYKYTFTVGNLMLEEFTTVAHILAFSDLRAEKDNIINNNLLNIKSESSRNRFFSEMLNRSDNIGNHFWKHFIDADHNEKAFLMFYLLLKNYLLLFDLHKDVILPKVRTLNLTLNSEDVHIFFQNKSIEHPEINNWSDTTRTKIISAIFLIYSRANLLNKNSILITKPTNKFWLNFLYYGDRWFLEFAFLNKFERENILREYNEFRQSV
jgi:hypothetical protein